VVDGNGTIELIVVWVSSVECPVLFNEVFDSSLVHVISLEHEVLDAYSPNLDEDDRRRSFEFGLRTVMSNIVSKSSNRLRLKEMHLSSFFVDNDDFHWDLVDLHLLWTRGTHVLDTIDCSDYLELKSSFYRSLIPTKAVADLMSSADFKRDHEYTHLSKDVYDDEDETVSVDDEMVIGIHIRAFDSSYDWEVVNPIQRTVKLVFNNFTKKIDVFSPSTTTDDSPCTAKRFDQVQSIDVFIAFMNSILTIHPAAKFFIASNSVQLKVMIQHHFINQLGPSRIHTVLPQTIAAGGHDRGTKEGMIIAVADFLLLGQTRLIAHTMGSSFGREAGCIQNVPVIDVSTA